MARIPGGNKKSERMGASLEQCAHCVGDFRYFNAVGKKRFFSVAQFFPPLFKINAIL